MMLVGCVVIHPNAETKTYRLTGFVGRVLSPNLIFSGRPVDYSRMAARLGRCENGLEAH